MFFLFILFIILLLALPGGASTGQEVTATPLPPADPDGWRTYPDTDPLLEYTGDWQTFSVAAAYGGTLTGTADPGATLRLHFAGTGVRVLYSAGPEGGPFEGLLDQSWVRYPDNAASAYSYGHVVAFDGLEAGTHTLTLRTVQHALWVEAVQVQGFLLPPPGNARAWNTYQDTDPRLRYAGGEWQTAQVPAAMGGTLTGTTSRDATLLVAFEGTAIRVIFSKGPTGQILVAQVDDDHPRGVNLHAPQPSYSHVMTFDDLPPGRHILTITKGEGAAWIEAFQIKGTLLPYTEPAGPPASSSAESAPALPPDGAAYGSSVTEVTSLYLPGNFELVEGVDTGTFSLAVLADGQTFHATYQATEGWFRSQSSIWYMQTINGPVTSVVLEVTGPAIPLEEWTDDCPAVGTWFPVLQPYDRFPSEVIPIEGGYRYVYTNLNQEITSLGGYANTYRACPMHLLAPKTYEWYVQIVSVNGGSQILPTVTPAPTVIPTITPMPTPTPSPTAQPVCIVEVTEPKNWYTHPAPARTERFGLVPDPDTPPVGIFQVGDELELDARYFRGTVGNPSFEKFVYRVKKVNGETLTGEAWISTNSGLIGIDTSNCESDYLYLQVSPRTSRETTLENIRDYGVDVQPTPNGPPSGLAKSWSEGELLSIWGGVELIAEAFSHYSSIRPLQTLFREVMTRDDHDYFLFRRVNGFFNCEVPEGGLQIDCGYMQNPDPPSSGPYWTPNGLLTAEAAVHEMGHVFDARTGGALGNQVGNASVFDCRKVISGTMGYSVLGNSILGWQRGQNGWGSSALKPDGTTQISQFQQNPTSTAYETAADMFLNWVYRRASDTVSVLTLDLDDACVAPDSGSWLGFQNINELDEPNVYLDSQGLTQNARPGNRRYWWMHITVEGLFDDNSAWQ